MANAILNVGQTGGQVNISTAAAPATPAVGVVTLYAGTDKALHALNSDGTDITIAAAGAASPITVQQTNSLVSTGVGATAASGVNCAVSIGNNATLFPGATGTIVLGNSSVGGTGACNSVVIGNNLQNTGVKSIVIGQGISNPAPQTIHIATGSSTVCNTYNINGGVSIGNAGGSTFDSYFLGGEQVGTMIGAWAGTFGGGGGSILLGGFSNRLTNSLQSSVLSGALNCIDNVYRASVVGGYDNRINVGDASSIFSGTSNRICTSAGNNNTIIGAVNSCINGVLDSNSIIGSQLSIIAGSSYRTHLIGGYGNNACADHSSIISGSENCIKNGYYSNILGGQQNKIGFADYGRFSTIISSIGSCYTGGFGPNVILGGCLNTISSTERFNNIIGGCSNTIGSTFCNVNIIGGSSVTAAKSNAVYVPSLIATGQAASLTNAVGSTGGSVTLNWDNSNIQTLTLTSNITTLTKSNPIDGAVYTLFLTQGASGGYTVAWGADVEWAGGTGPTLSTAIGAVDAVSLVYIAGITGYYGNANLNFS